MKLKLSGISKSYGPHHVLRDISLQLDDIRALTIIGPSGGGKSTLLRVIAGLEIPDSGTMEINGEPVPFDDRSLLRYRRTIGTVFQAYNLFPHLTALENITLPLEKVHRLSDEEAERRAFDLLVRFRLEDHSHKKPGQMSGGQKQRVAIARALAIRPRFLLFDEPTSALDPEMTAEVLDIVEELLRDSCDVIIVTHQMAFAQRFSDRVLFVAGGQIAESGTTQEIFENPQSVDLVRFLRKTLRY